MRDYVASNSKAKISHFFFLQGDDIKPCPRCQVLIVKMDDGSCNHMTCAVCTAEFCWLCMKEISDLHYLRYYSFFFFYRISGLADRTLHPLLYLNSSKFTQFYLIRWIF